MQALFYPDWEKAHIPEIIKEIYLDDIYYWVFHDKQHLTAKKDMVVVDVGANLGLVSARALPFAKTVYALEPDDDNFEALQMNIAYNNWNKIVPIKKALWTYTGKVDFTINKDNNSGHSITPSFTGEKKEVSCVTLDYLMQEYNIDVIDFLKIDIEGAEHQVFPSEQFVNVLPKVREILVEIHGNDTDTLVNFLKSQKFFATKQSTNAKCFWATNTREI